MIPIVKHEVRKALEEKKERNRKKERPGFVYSAPGCIISRSD